ncbi:hypothetical protein MRB53_039107 [Persea americana]|nr:hypothetical protein MRB53_039107 [Persea americana]
MWHLDRSCWRRSCLRYGKAGCYKGIYLSGGLLTAAGGILLYTVHPGNPMGLIYSSSSVLGARVGMFLQMAFPVVQAIAGTDNSAAAAGTIALAQYLGLVVALCTADAIILDNSEGEIRRLLPGTSRIDLRAAILNGDSTFMHGQPQQLQSLVLELIVYAIDNTYLVVIAGGALVTVPSLILRRTHVHGWHGGEVNHGVESPCVDCIEGCEGRGGSCMRFPRDLNIEM